MDKVDWIFASIIIPLFIIVQYRFVTWRSREQKRLSEIEKKIK